MPKKRVLTIKMKSNRFWLLLLGILLLGSGIIGFYFMGGTGTMAVISQKGEVLYEIDLASVKTPYTIEIEGRYLNIVEVDHNRICVRHADCPDQVCVDTGWIEDGSRPIVCLPNQLVIEIKDEGMTADIAVK